MTSKRKSHSRLKAHADAKRALARVATLLTLCIILVGASCTPPIESRVPLSDPGTIPYDERLIGVWSAAEEFDGWGHWLLHIAPHTEPGQLHVLVQVATDESRPHWFYALAHASELAGARFLNFRRVPGIGDDYAVFEPGTCRLVHPDQEPGFIIARWEMPNDDALELYFIGREPKGESQEAANAWFDELEQLTSRENINLRTVNVDEFEVLWGETRTIIDIPRNSLAEVIIRQTPGALFARPTLSLQGRDGPRASLRRLSHNSHIEAPSPPGSIRYDALTKVMDLRFRMHDISGATKSAQSLLAAAECFDADMAPATIRARLLVDSAAPGTALSTVEQDAAIAKYIVESELAAPELLELVRLTLRLGNEVEAADLLIWTLRQQTGPWPSGISPGDIRELFLEIARKHVVEGNGARAQELIDRSVEARAKDASALVFFAELQAELGLGRDSVTRTVARASYAAETFQDLVAVARAQLDVRNRSAAAATLERARNAARTPIELIEVAKALRAAGDAEAAKASLAQAAAVGPIESWDTLRSESEALIAAGEVERAVAVVARFANALWPMDAQNLLERVREAVAEQDSERALTQLDHAAQDVVNQKLLALRAVAEAHLAAGDESAAADTLRTIPHQTLRAGSPLNLKNLIELQLRAGDSVAARRNIERYRASGSGNDTGCRLPTLVAVARWYKALGDAAALVAVRLELSELSANDLLVCRPRLAGAVAKLREMGETDLATALARKSIEAEIEIGNADGLPPSLFLDSLYPFPTANLIDAADVADEWRPPRDREQMIDDAGWLVALASRAGKQNISDTVASSLKLAAALIYADADALDPARDILAMIDLDGPATAVVDPGDDVFSMAVSAIAAAQARAGDRAGARAMLSRIEALPIDRFPNSATSDVTWYRPYLLYFAARILAERAESRLAREALAKAGTHLTSDLGRSKLFGILAGAQYAVGDAGAARQTVHMAATSIRLLRDPSMRAELLTALAEIQFEMDDFEGATSTVGNAFYAAMQIPLLPGPVQ